MAEKDVEPVYYEDPSGNKIKLTIFRGTPIPTMVGDNKERMRQWPNFKAREDDVFICGYIKCGTNWVWEVVSMLLSSSTESVSVSKLTGMLEYHDQDLFDQMKSPRVLNTHIVFNDLPKDIFAKKSKIVYLLRNPKDVCVSSFYHNRNIVGCYDYHGEWKDYIHLWVEGKVDYGCYFDYIKKWEEEIKNHPEVPVYVLHYEGLKLDFVGEAKKLAKFLGVSHGEEFFEDLATKCDIGHMKAVKASSFTDAERKAWRDSNVMFFRKGIIGDWKNQFTVAQNEEFDKIVQEKMKGSDLKFIYEN